MSGVDWLLLPQCFCGTKKKSLVPRSLPADPGMLEPPKMGARGHRHGMMNGSHSFFS